MLGLRKRPTYNEVINYLENEQPKIKYPDRRATFLRNSPYLTQFDGDSWIDLDEQENNIAKEKLKEEEVKRISSEEKETAQVIRATRKKLTINTQGNQTDVSTMREQGTSPRELPETTDRGAGVGKRNKSVQAAKTIYGASSGVQTDDAPTKTTQIYRTSSGVQTDDAPTEIKGGSIPQIFDMTVDDAVDDTMQSIDETQQQEEEKANKKKQLIYDKVSRHNREEIRDLPYLRASKSSSSNEMPAYLAEDTSNPRGRPPDPNKPINDGTENTSQPRGRRKIFIAGENSNPMIVNTEAEQQKRGESNEPPSAPPRPAPRSG